VLAAIFLGAATQTIAARSRSNLLVIFGVFEVQRLDLLITPVLGLLFRQRLLASEK
jgi:hypothetical protein